MKTKSKKRHVAIALLLSFIMALSPLFSISAHAEESQDLVSITVSKPLLGGTICLSSGDQKLDESSEITIPRNEKLNVSIEADDLHEISKVSIVDAVTEDEMQSQSIDGAKKISWDIKVFSDIKLVVEYRLSEKTETQKEESKEPVKNVEETKQVEPNTGSEKEVITSLRSTKTPTVTNLGLPVEVLYGKGSVNLISGNIYQVIPDEGYILWRIVPEDDYLDKQDIKKISDDLYEISSSATVIKAYFVSAAEYEQINNLFPSEEEKLLTHDNPKWIFKYGKEQLSKEAWNEVYGEYYKAQKRKNPEYNTFTPSDEANQMMAMRTSFFKANNATGTRNILRTSLAASYSIPSTYVPSVGATFSGSAHGLWPNGFNQSGGNNVYPFKFDSGYLGGAELDLECLAAGKWAPGNEHPGEYVAEITSVDTANHTFTVYVTWTPNKSGPGTSNRGDSIQPCGGYVTLNYTPPNGYLKLKKTSANPEWTNSRSDFSLEGAVYDVYSNSNLSGWKGSLTTDVNGNTNTLTLERGTYYVKEYSAPKGFKLDATVHTVTVSSEQTTTLTVSDVPKSGNLTLRKISALPEITDGNNCYSLAGAQYNVYSDSGCTKLVGTLTTDETGYANSLSLFIGNYYVKETKAPKGYGLDASVYNVTVRAGTKTWVNGDSVKDIPQGDPVSISLKKVDAETGEEIPLEKGSLKGAKYLYKYYDNYTWSGEAKYEWTFTTDENGKILFRPDYLADESVSTTIPINAVGVYVVPVGSITIQEVAAPEGYLLDNTVFKYTIEAVDNMPTVKDENGNETCNLDVNVTPIVREQVLRGDYSFTKVEAKRSRPVANCVFKVTAEASGESHMIMTDANGYWSSASDFNLHTKDTNGGTESSGTWFGQNSKGEPTEAKDNMGAFPYGTYIFEEMRCDANKGLELISWKVDINRNDIVINGGTKVDNYLPVIELTSDATVLGEKQCMENEASIITDVVKMKNLIVGETYILKGRQIVKETGEQLIINGKAVEAETRFTATATEMEITQTFDVDLSGLGNKHLVTFEEIYNVEDLTTCLAKDADLANNKQTVWIIPTPGWITVEMFNKFKGGEGGDVLGLIIDGSPKTGDFIPYSAIIMSLITSLAIILVFASKEGKRTKWRKE